MQSLHPTVVSDYISHTTYPAEETFTQEEIDRFWDNPQTECVKTPEEIFGKEIYARMCRIIAAHLQAIEKQVKIRKLNIAAAYQLCKDRIGYYDMPYIGLAQSQTLTTEQRARANSVAIILKKIYGDECEKYFRLGREKKREAERQKIMNTIANTGDGSSIIDIIDVDLINNLTPEDEAIILERLDREEKLARALSRPMVTGGKVVRTIEQDQDYHRYKQQWMLGSRMFRDWADGLREAFIIMDIPKYLTMTLEQIKDDVLSPRTTEFVRTKIRFAQQLVQERFGISLQLI